MINVEEWATLILFLTVVSVDGALAPTVDSCSRHWLKMNDANYNKAIERYETCIAMLGALTGYPKRLYQTHLVRNLRKTSDFFFQRTDLPPVEVVRVMRNVAKLLDYLGSYNCNSQVASQICETDETFSFTKSLFRTKLLFYGFLLLAILQSLLLLYILIRCCCTNDLKHEPECSYTRCKDRAWLQNLERSCQINLALKDESSLRTMDRRRPWAYPVPSAEYTNYSVKKAKEENILTDLSTLPSSGLGSDSEIDAFINRRPLPKSKKRSNE